MLVDLSKDIALESFKITVSLRHLILIFDVAAGREDISTTVRLVVAGIKFLSADYLYKAFFSPDEL